MPINHRLALSYAATCIHGAEGFRAVAYLDHIARPPVWTIGYGTTRIHGRAVRAGDTCTKAEADAWAAEDMETALTYVLVHCDVPVDNWQVAALVSLTYNIGPGHFRDSTVLAALNEGRYRTAADCFLEYDHAGGVRIPGLTARRQRERAMFLAMTPDLTPPTVSASLSEADVLNAKELDRLHKEQT